jgi:AcrR family transcriptional regulator
MRKPRSQMQKTTRDRILDAAAKIVMAQGVGAATTKLIATEAGVSEGSLYNHFADKPQLLITLVLERLPSIREVFDALQQAADGAALPDRLVAALAAMIEFYARAQPIIGGISADPMLLALCRQRFAETGEGPHRAHEKLTAFLQQAQKSGRIRRGAKPDVIASLLIGACTEYASLANLTGREPGGLSKIAYAKAIIATLSPLLFEAKAGPRT